MLLLGLSLFNRGCRGNAWPRLRKRCDRPSHGPCPLCPVGPAVINSEVSGRPAWNAAIAHAEEAVRITAPRILFSIRRGPVRIEPSSRPIASIGPSPRSCMACSRARPASHNASVWFDARRPDAGSQTVPSNQELVPNWATGIILWYCAGPDAADAGHGRRSRAAFFCLPASILAISAAAIFHAHRHRLGDRGRLVIGSVAGFSALLWLQLSFLMFQSPIHISRARSEEAWPRLTSPAFEFEVGARAPGRLAVLGMGLFVLAVLCLGLINRNQTAACHHDGRDEHAA